MIAQNHSMLTPGFVSVTFRAIPPKDIVQLCVQNGLEGIEWGGDVHVPHGDLQRAREVRKQTTDAGLFVTAYGSYFRLGISEQQGLSFDKVFASAVELEAPVIRIWAGLLHSADATSEQRLAIAQEALRIADRAAKGKIIVACEYHAKTLTDTDASAQQFLREADHPNLKTYWQPHMPGKIDPELTGLRSILPRLQDVHFPDWGRIKDPPSDNSMREPWQKVFGLLRTTGRNHWVMLEFLRNDSIDELPSQARRLKEWLKDTSL